MFLGFSKTGNRVEDDSFFLEAISSYMIDSSSIYAQFGNLANISAMIFSYMEDINWAGFYLFDGEKLVLGPFQGEPACSTISLDRGVCGASATEKKTLIVPDVSMFPGHIACSGKSRSELVVPILEEDKLIGVIDIDSPLLDRFSSLDASLIERVASLVSDILIPR